MRHDPHNAFTPPFHPSPGVGMGAPSSVLGLVTILAATALAGCLGGDDGGAAPAGTPILERTKAGFLTRAAIVRRATEKQPDSTPQGRNPGRLDCSAVPCGREVPRATGSPKPDFTPLASPHVHAPLITATNNPGPCAPGSTGSTRQERSHKPDSVASARIVASEKPRC